MKKILDKRNLTSLIIFVCSFVLLFVMFCRGDAVYKNKIVGKPILTLGTDDITKKNDCRIENGMYIPEGKNPYIEFKTDGTKAACARLVYSENDEPVISAILGFAEKESDFKVDGAPAFVKNNRYNTKDGLIFVLNGGNNTLFRLQIAESIRIDGLEFYEEPIITQESMSPVSPYRYLAVLGGSLLIAIICRFLYARLSADDILTLERADLFLKRRRRLICALVLSAVTLLLAISAIGTFTGGAVKYFKMFAFAAIVAAVVLIYRMIYLRMCKIETAFLISAVFMGVFCMIMFTPLTIPDEPTHLFSAYKMSNYFTFDFANKSTTLIRRTDLDTFRKYASTDLTRSYYGVLKKCSAFFCSDSTLTEIPRGMNAGAPFGYVFSGLGVALARLLNLGALPLFYIGRTFNFAAYVAMVYFAIKKIPVGKIAVCAIALMPMSLQLAVSYSYDPIVLAFALLLVSHIVYLIYKPESVTRKDIAIVSVFAALLAPNKLVYAPLVFLAILIPQRNFTSKRSAVIGKTVIIAAGIASLLVFQVFTLGSTISSAGGIIGWAGEPGYSVTWSLAYPFAAVKVYLETLSRSFSFYIETMVGNRFGWLTIYVNWIYTATALMLLLLSFLRKEGEPAEALRPTGRLFIIITVLVSVFLIMTSMYLAWTPQSSPSIQGVQGRYFIPLLLPVALVFRVLPLKLSKNFDRHIMLLIFFSNTALFADMLRNIPA